MNISPHPFLRTRDIISIQKKNHEITALRLLCSNGFDSNSDRGVYRNLTRFFNILRLSRCGELVVHKHFDCLVLDLIPGISSHFVLGIVDSKVSPSVTLGHPKDEDSMSSNKALTEVFAQYVILTILNYVIC